MATLFAMVGLVSALAPIAASTATASDREWQGWRERHLRAVHEVDAARLRNRAAIEAYKRARHRRRARGEKKSEFIAAREAARVELLDVERRLAEFLERARRAGVPAGYLRSAPAAPAPTP